MFIQNALSAPVFFALLFLTYIAMWIYISKHKVKHHRNKE